MAEPGGGWLPTHKEAEPLPDMGYEAARILFLNSCFQASLSKSTKGWEFRVKRHVWDKRGIQKEAGRLLFLHQPRKGRMLD